ncbi:pantoate--beta-alanine ligase [Helicobacter sp. 11S02596-1]|nr:pantoate--beta-alanine ligase [Helicobacter sp. 11S02596-1]
MAYQKNLQETLEKDTRIGLVPTMGALHAGHLSLVRTSKQQNTITIVSIFVNPTQFGPNEDFKQYPRDLQKDLSLCEETGVDVVFAPQVATMYPQRDTICLNPPKNMGYVYEGFVREGHFNGVLAIVLKLFNLIKPHRAYFGQKDAQQLLIIKRLVQEFFLPIEIIACPTQRDTDGLALSSRNIYLSSEERKNARKIPQALQTIAKAIEMGETKSAPLLQMGKKALEGIECEYLAICDYELAPLENIQKNASLVLLAAKIGKTRLIDNLWV